MTTDCRGVKEFVVNEENALLVPIKKPEDLAQSIIKLYNNPELSKKLRQNGLETAEKLSWERVVDVFEKAFKDALEKQ